MVHRGVRYNAPVVIDADVLLELHRLTPLAPLPQIAFFDTAFHETLSLVESSVVLPRALRDEGLRRYGFYGLSYEYIALLGAPAAAGRVVMAHLRPLDDLPMGTRCGVIDPGAVLYLLQERGLSAADVSDLLYHDSGLLGISSVSGDMQTLLDSETPAAKEAVDLFVYRIGRELASLAAALGGFNA